MFTFNTEGDAARAASQTFKNISGGVLAAFDKYKKPEFPDVEVDEPFRVRFALGSGVRTCYTNRMNLVLFKHDGQNSHSFYVKTFYPHPPDELREIPAKTERK